MREHEAPSEQFDHRRFNRTPAIFPGQDNLAISGATMVQMKQIAACTNF
jgi:hypothetical protein